MKRKTFDQIQKKYKAAPFLASPRGSLYFVKATWRKPDLIIRHFDGSLQPELLQAYTDLTQACREWIEAYPALNATVRVEPLVEIGEDYVARKYIVGTSLLAYQDNTQDIPRPPELKRMARAFEKSRGKSNRRRELIIEEVLARSILESTAKTIYDMAQSQKFVILEPRFTLEHLQEWKNEIAKSDHLTD